MNNYCDKYAGCSIDYIDCQDKCKYNPRNRRLLLYKYVAFPFIFIATLILSFLHMTGDLSKDILDEIIEWWDKD